MNQKFQLASNHGFMPQDFLMWYSPRSATKLSDMSNYIHGLLLVRVAIPETTYPLIFLLLPAIDPNLHEAKSNWVRSLALALENTLTSDFFACVLKFITSKY